jgi:hypothetical protein
MYQIYIWTGTGQEIGSHFLAGMTIFSFSHLSDRLCDHTASYSMGMMGSFPRGREADQLRPSTAEVKNGEAIPLMPQPLHWVVHN